MRTWPGAIQAPRSRVGRPMRVQSREIKRKACACAHVPLSSTKTFEWQRAHACMHACTRCDSAWHRSKECRCKDCGVLRSQGRRAPCCSGSGRGRPRVLAMAQGYRAGSDNNPTAILCGGLGRGDNSPTAILSPPQQVMIGWRWGCCEHLDT